MAKVALELPSDQAMALAQLVKRLGYDDAERFSSRYDGGQERDAMLGGIDQLQRALAEAGFAPRRDNKAGPVLGLGLFHASRCSNLRNAAQRPAG